MDTGRRTTETGSGLWVYDTVVTIFFPAHELPDRAYNTAH
ncbi:MAG: hypothetical protein JWM46_395 [Candidatus Kaiserbacteria bacterium]|nr:hypothetical protein [Candidatus Kaiserbacteria bacterium]